MSFKYSMTKNLCGLCVKNQITIEIFHHYQSTRSTVCIKKTIRWTAQNNSESFKYRKAGRKSAKYNNEKKKKKFFYKNVMKIKSFCKYIDQKIL